jgi:hypothetical protein
MMLDILQIAYEQLHQGGGQLLTKTLYLQTDVLHCPVKRNYSPVIL